MEEPAAKKADIKTIPDISIPVDNKTTTAPTTKPVSAPVAKPVATTATKPVNNTSAKPATTGKSPSISGNTRKPTNTKNTGVKAQRQPLIEDTGIDFNDGFGNAVRKKNDTIPAKKKAAAADKKAEKKKIPNLEDEYYELEGF